METQEDILNEKNAIAETCEPRNNMSKILLPAIPNEASTGAPPDGGLQAWLVVSAASCIMSMSFGMCNTFGVYQTYYEQKYHNTPSNVLSIIGALQAGLTMLMAVPSTTCVYYVGPQVMVAIGGMMACLSFMFLSITKTVAEVFIVQGLMFGMGSGIMYIHSTAVTFQYFDKRKGLAQGVITAASSLGGVYWPIAIRNLIAKVGFGWANRIIGFLYLPMVVISVLFLKPRVAVKKRSPGENILRLKFNVLLNSKYMAINFAWFLYGLSLFPGLFYIDLFCIRGNINKQFQLYSVAIINSCSCVFRVIPGFYADKVGRINLLIPALFLSGIFPLCMWLPASRETPPGNGLTISFIVLWASASAVPIAIFPPVIGQLFRGNEMYSYLSFFLVFGGIGCFLGPVIGGTFIPKGTVANTDGFDKLAIFVGVLCLGSTSIMMAVRFCYAKPREKI